MKLGSLNPLPNKLNEHCLLGSSGPDSTKNLIEDCEHDYDDFPYGKEESLTFWLPKFVVEVRKGNGDPYPPNSLYQICCGLQRGLKAANRAELDIFNSPRFVLFRDTLDSQMKILKAPGVLILVKPNLSLRV